MRSKGGGTTVANRLRWAPVVAAMLLLAAALVSRLAADASVAAVSSTMHARVGPGYEISLTFDDGSTVLALPAGTYTVQVEDAASDHNFHLFGPGVEQATSVRGVGRRRGRSSSAPARATTSSATPTPTSAGGSTPARSRPGPPREAAGA